MNTVLWILQGLVAALFIMSGLFKLGKSKEDLKKQASGMNWVDNLSGSTLKLIGGLEVLAAMGLILPQLTGILQWLTALAAVGIILTMIGAMQLHIRRGDGIRAISGNVILLLLAALIGFGRFVLVPVI